MARLLDFEVLICDPREEFVYGWEDQHGRFVPGMPDEAVLNIHTDERTAIVCLTHDPRLDDMALLTALNSTAFYIGALGSRVNTQKRRENLTALGLSADAIARLHGADRPAHRQPYAGGNCAVADGGNCCDQERGGTDAEKAVGSGGRVTVTAIVLAAGQGSRFRTEAGADQDKLLAACVGLDGISRPVIEQVLRNLPERVVTRWLVTSPERGEVIRLAEAYGCQVVLLDSSGMGDSIAAAVKASGAADGWLVVLGDMPFIQSSSIERVIASVEGVTVPVSAGSTGTRWLSITGLGRR